MPPNSTSKIQPLDAGATAWVKAKYRYLFFRAFDKTDVVKKSIKTVEFLTEM